MTQKNEENEKIEMKVKRERKGRDCAQMKQNLYLIIIILFLIAFGCKAGNFISPILGPLPMFIHINYIFS